VVERCEDLPLLLEARKQFSAVEGGTGDLDWMYILRAYQSPSSAADCGPQCAQMPNLASLNHSAIRYAFSPSTDPSKGPLAISGKDI
jgi:hypothetical protein